MAKLLTLHGQVINSTAYIYIYIYETSTKWKLKLNIFMAHFWLWPPPPPAAAAVVAAWLAPHQSSADRFSFCFFGSEWHWSCRRPMLFMGAAKRRQLKSCVWVHALRVVRQHTLLRRVLRRFWGGFEEEFSEGFLEGGLLWDYSNKGSWEGFSEGVICKGFQKVPRTPPRRVRPLSALYVCQHFRPHGYRTVSKYCVRPVLLVLVFQLHTIHPWQPIPAQLRGWRLAPLIKGVNLQETL